MAAPAISEPRAKISVAAMAHFSGSDSQSLQISGAISPVPATRDLGWEDSYCEACGRMELEFDSVIYLVSSARRTTGISHRGRASPTVAGISSVLSQ